MFEPKFRAALLGAAAIFAAPQAYAQAAEEAPQAQEQSGGEPDIVVTAQRRPERLQDTPIALTAYTSEALETRGVTNIQGISNTTPNVELRPTTRPTGGSSAIGVFIRGVGTGDYNFPTDPGVGMYVDGVYLARTLGGLISLVDIERIEVLKGPQGTLFGRNTIGGAVNVITSSPRTRGGVTGSVQVRGGSFGRFDASGSINGPLVEDVIGAQLAIGYYSSDGYIRSLNTGRRFGNEGRFVVRGGLRFAMSPDFTLDLKADYTRQRQNVGTVPHLYAFGTNAARTRFNTIAAPALNASLGLPADARFDERWFTNDVYTTHTNTRSFDNNDIGGASATFEYNASPAFNLKSITAYRKLDSAIEADPDNSPYDISRSTELITSNQFSQEVQFSGAVADNRLNYVVGGYYFSEVGSLNKTSLLFHGTYEVTGLASDARDSLTRVNYRARSWAAFGQATWEVFDGVRLTAGGRYNVDKKYYDVTLSLPQTGAVTVPLRVGRKRWNSFTPKATIDWKPSENVLIYASYSQGFKSGGFGQPTATVPMVTYDPEKLKSFEVGLKAQWFDKRLTTNFAVFKGVWSDIQLSVLGTGPNGNIISITQNGGEAKPTGFEAEIVAIPVDSLRLNFSAGYVDNDITALTPQAAAAGLKVGTALANTPKWTLSGGAQYTADTAIGEFTLRGDLSYRDRQFLTINDPLSIQKSYTIVDASLSFKPRGLEGLTLSADAKNLTDQRYFIYDFGGLASLGIREHAPGTPREFFVRARYAF